MIDLEFDTSRISVLLNTVLHYKEMIICEKNGLESKFSTAPAKSNNFFKLISSKPELRKILTEEELNIFQKMITKNVFNKKDFVSTILGSGYEVLSDDNFEMVFTRCLNEWKAYYEEEGKKSSNERQYQYTDEQITFSLDSIDDMLKNQKIIIGGLHKLMATDEFRELYNITLNYRNNLENNWNDNKEKISNFIEKTTGIKHDTHSKVMVLPPLFDNGRTTNEGDRGIYYSRCHDDRENHELMELTYLTHESMHSQFLPYKKCQNIDSIKKLHGFIQYLCDNELYSRLATEKGINYHYGENSYHGIDKETFENMYPFFIGYLYRNEENPAKSILDNMIRNKKYSIRENKTGKHIALMYSPNKIAQLFQNKKNLSPYEFSMMDFSLAENLFTTDSENQRDDDPRV